MANIVAETNIKAALAQFMAEREKAAAKLNQVLNGQCAGSEDQVDAICASIDKITRAEANAEYAQSLLVNLMGSKLSLEKLESLKKESNDDTP